jgi:hypothetical protein
MEIASMVSHEKRSRESYIYYAVLAPEHVSEMLRAVGVTEYECVDDLTASADRLGLTKVFLDARQAKRP